jgi:hypothetical protein
LPPVSLAHALVGGELHIFMKNTHGGARTHDHKVEGLEVGGLSSAGCYCKG